MVLGLIIHLHAQLPALRGDCINESVSGYCGYEYGVMGVGGMMAPTHCFCFLAFSGYHGLMAPHVTFFMGMAFRA
jgi:hypothetical protein